MHRFWFFDFFFFFCILILQNFSWNSPLTPEIFSVPLNVEPKASASLSLLKPWPCPAHFSRVFSRTCWFCHPACHYRDVSLVCICMCIYILPCSEVGKANIKQELFFWSLHAVCMRLLRKTLARKVSLWIYKLSDNQRSGEKIVLPQESEICHLPGVRNRTERKGQVSHGLNFTLHIKFSWLTQCWFTFSLWGKSFYLLICFDSDVTFLLFLFFLPWNSFKQIWLAANVHISFPFSCYCLHLKN